VELASLYQEPAVAEPGAPPALEAVDVFRIYRSQQVETVALRGLSLRIAQGEFVALVGPSGCGKSTFLHLAAGLDRPSAGEVRALGQPLTGLSEDGLARYRSRQLALVFQQENLLPAISAEDNVRLSLSLAGVRSDAAARAQEALRMVGLWHRRDLRAGSLSGGEQQRVAIAAAAARRAPLVLCDEPTGELDQANEDLVLETLRELCGALEATVVIVTHSPRVADSADRTIRITDGRVAN
jgi:putative ABC transport system ATP-binding protein